MYTERFFFFLLRSIEVSLVVQSTFYGVVFTGLIASHLANHQINDLGQNT